MQTRVTDFIQELAWQNLKNLSLTADSDTGEIDPAHEDQLMSLINQGLRDITTRKKILTDIRVVTFVDGTNSYDLLPLVDPRLDEFVQVMEVVSVPTGEEVITANQRRFTLKTTQHILLPNYHTIWFSNEFMEDYGPAVDVHCQIHHETVIYSDASLILLPPTLNEALKLYVSGLFHSHMGGEENKKRGDEDYGLYLKMMEDDRISNHSGLSEVTDYDSRFSDRGFV